MPIIHKHIIFTVHETGQHVYWWTHVCTHMLFILNENTCTAQQTRPLCDTHVSHTIIINCSSWCDQVYNVMKLTNHSEITQKPLNLITHLVYECVCVCVRVCVCVSVHVCVSHSYRIIQTIIRTAAVTSKIPTTTTTAITTIATSESPTRHNTYLNNYWIISG